jgi:hypothetical protein
MTQNNIREKCFDLRIDDLYPQPCLAEFVINPTSASFKKNQYLHILEKYPSFIEGQNKALELINSSVFKDTMHCVVHVKCDRVFLSIQSKSTHKSKNKIRAYKSLYLKLFFAVCRIRIDSSEVKKANDEFSHYMEKQMSPLWKNS